MAMRASRSRTRDATNVLTATPDEFVLGLASFLPAKDLLSLCLTCPRFAAKIIAARSGGGEAAAAPEMLCIVEEAGQHGCGWRVAASMSVVGCREVALRAGCG